MMRTLYLTGALLPFMCLPACSSGANHVGNPLTLPGRAIIHGIGEAAYKARRAKVSDYVQQNLTQIHTDIRTRGGPALNDVMNIAGVEDARQAALTAELHSDPDLYLKADYEPIIVTIMVHSN